VTYQWGKGSRKVLTELVPELRVVASLGLEILGDRGGPDIRLTDGLRTPQEASANAAASVGIRNSKHLPGPEGLALAFDFVPLEFADPWPRKGDSPLVREAKMEAFRIAIAAFLEAADTLSVVVRSGADWDCDGVWTDHDEDEKKNLPDYAHIEVVRMGEKRFSAAISARSRREAARERGETWQI
jgi:hypothetical protein